MPEFLEENERAKRMGLVKMMIAINMVYVKEVREHEGEETFRLHLSVADCVTLSVEIYDNAGRSGFPNLDEFLPGLPVVWDDELESGQWMILGNKESQIRESRLKLRRLAEQSEDVGEG